VVEDLVAVYEADGVAMENCGEHDWEVEGTLADCKFRYAGWRPLKIEEPLFEPFIFW
jgi:hypothetical protein